MEPSMIMSDYVHMTKIQNGRHFHSSIEFLVPQCIQGGVVNYFSYGVIPNPPI